jgi:pyrroline-5-carboxylate reductase
MSAQESSGRGARDATADSAASSAAAGPHLALSATFIGGGNMATALLGGLIEAGASPASFHVVDPSAPQRERLVARLPGVQAHDAIAADALSGSGIVVMAVKPQQMREAARALAPHVAAVPVVLTIAAGIRVADLARWLGGYSRIVRAMPNTPALIGSGISGVYADPSVDVRSRDVAAHVLEAAGEMVWFDREALLDVVTGVSASGPAFVFYLIEALERAGTELGLTRTTARQLAYATFEGAVALARATGEDLATLRANVTSKGGTTERGLQVLGERAVAQALRDAVAAAAARATEMGDEFGAA